MSNKIKSEYDYDNYTIQYETLIPMLINFIQKNQKNIKFFGEKSFEVNNSDGTSKISVEFFNNIESNLWRLEYFKIATKVRKKYYIFNESYKCFDEMYQLKYDELKLPIFEKLTKCCAELCKNIKQNRIEKKIELKRNDLNDFINSVENKL